MPHFIQQELCTCCHRCRVECPAQAIRFKNSKYWIDPERCDDCGHCVEVCHNDVISNPDKPSHEAAYHDTIRKFCDVLVIGGGAAGMAAAARAATLGKRVVVMEKNKEVGGCAWYAHVFRSHWSDWHREAGMEDPREKIHRQFMKKTMNHVNSKLVRRILDADADFVNWLIREHDLGRDFKFGDNPFGGKGLVGTYEWDYNVKRIDTTIGPGGTGWFLCLKLLEIIEKNNGEVLYNTAALKLLTDEAGTITGVIGKDEGGEVIVACKSCVIAAGTFTRNRELTAKFNNRFYQDEGNEPVHVFSCSTCTGDGITMCDELGADIDYHNSRTGMFGPMRHPFGTCSIAAGMAASSVKIDKCGNVYDQPFTFTEVSPLADIPGRFLWSITDERAIEESIKASRGMTPDVVGIDMDKLYADWRQELEIEISWDTMYKADTLEELAKKINVPHDKLKASVDNYNRHVNDPRPPMAIPPGKENRARPEPKTIDKGPYYAIFLKLFHENGIGGVVIDENTSVLRNGIPILGLYAAGDNTRGIMLAGEVGTGYIEATISALTFAFTSGFVAGKEAAKHAG